MLWDLTSDSDVTITSSSNSGVTITMAQDDGVTRVLTLSCSARFSGNVVKTTSKEITVNWELPKYVDLGLPSGLKWATGNIVSDGNGGYKIGNETDYGYYFSWGNITGYKSTNGSTFDGGYDWGGANYGPYASTPGSSIPYTSQHKNADYAADSGYDAARENLGGSWRMPTANEFQELYDNTDNEWTSVGGVYGRKFMKKLDHSVYVFFPAAGFSRNT